MLIADAAALISLPAAMELVAERIPVLGSEDVAVRRAAGRILAADVVAKDEIVGFARAAMDGYAVCAADGPGRFPITTMVYARHREQVVDHAPRTAVPVATGAAMPPGTDAVIPEEDVAAADGCISFDAAPVRGQHVFPPGEDARRGETLLRAGRCLSAADLGMLAAAAYGNVAVRRRPRVAILCTGDELVAPGETARLGEVPDSNGVTLAASAERLGCDVVIERRLPDDATLIAHAIGDALDRTDVVATTGGASHGARDFVKSACAAAGVRMAFDAVAMKPARPTGFGRRGDRAVFALPGNPAAAYAAWNVFAVPYLVALAGRKPATPAFAHLRAGVRGKSGRHVFVFVELAERDGRLEASPLDNQCSSLVRNGSRADALAVIPPDARECSAGSLVHVVRIA
ncbi:MAG TPA: gephyrin-like molybdotransferase Glp [Candidatus Cybelea sp.]